MKALDKQIAGEHYKTLPIQPVEFCQRNGLGFCESSVIKYVSRHREKNGKQDIEKAIHFLELLIELEYQEGGLPITDKDEARMDIIGPNGNDGLHYPSWSVEIPVRVCGTCGSRDDGDHYDETTPALPPFPDGFLPWIEHDGGECPIPWARAGEWAWLLSNGSVGLVKENAFRVEWPDNGLDAAVTHYTIKEFWPNERMKDFIGKPVMVREWPSSDDWYGPYVLSRVPQQGPYMMESGAGCMHARPALSHEMEAEK